MREGSFPEAFWVEAWIGIVALSRSSPQSMPGPCHKPTQSFAGAATPAMIESCLMQAARRGRQAEPEAHTPFSSPGKRLKTPSASPAVRVLSSSPGSPELPPARTRAAPCDGGLSHSHDNVDAALAAVSAIVDGSCAETEHARSAADAASGQRAGMLKKSVKGAGAQLPFTVGPVQTAPVAQGSQGLSTPAKQPQARQRYPASKVTARDALAAAHKAAAKQIAQVLLECMSSRVLMGFILSPLPSYHRIPNTTRT